MTDEELKTLAAAMHELQYVVPGLIINFDMDFESHVAHVEWNGITDTYNVVYISEKEN